MATTAAQLQPQRLWEKAQRLRLEEGVALGLYKKVGATLGALEEVASVGQ